MLFNRSRVCRICGGGGHRQRRLSGDDGCGANGSELLLSIEVRIYIKALNI
jgi:hypothetical protein